MGITMAVENSPKFALILGSLCCFAVAFASMIAAGRNSNLAGRDSLYAKEEVVHCGDVGRGAKLPVQFQIVNGSSGTVVVEQVLPECSCTVEDSTVSEEAIEPGASTDLSLSWTVPKTLGRANSTACIVFSDENGNRKDLYVTAVCTVVD